ncbi:MAG TPA: D-aminoacyl-tRNA deacylase [Verrucomicrobiae bacterium]|nr:D-aminoacyl-tRNA deacylase [Verrucomicrobiae bacterium]
MKAVVQRVSRGSVRVDGQTVGEIGRGLLVLLGIGKDDTAADADWMIKKVLGLRIFPDDTKNMNRSVTDIGGEVLVVSQFTLCGDASRGTRPSFSDAMPPADAERFYNDLMAKLRGATALKVAEGKFAAMMDVELVNDGPVTIMVESIVKKVERASSPSVPVERASRLLKTDSSSILVPFDPETSIEGSRRELPHWQQPGRTYFVTFRLADSVPAEKLRQWKKLSDKNVVLDEFQAWLDHGHGECWLKRHEMATIVETALRHFDGQRYALGEYVIMPTHVHALVTPLAENTLADILHSWKSFTAHEINRALGRTGAVWQDESFDHIVRDEEALTRFEQYIQQNPTVAGLKEGEYLAGRGKS